MKGKTQVTSRGCSRAYVLCVLWRALDFVRRKWHEKIPVSFPFDDDDVLEWLIEAKNDAMDINFQTTVGLQDFNPRDEQTFWTDTKQFFLWWKNNIERRGKFRALLRDAVRCFTEAKTEPRALYCRQAIAICVNIKNHFQRIKNEQDDKSIVYQINCPLEMPETVPMEAILHVNRTEWREFDNYLAHIWSLKASDITSNIPICRLDIITQTLGNERLPSSSSTGNSPRRSVARQLTISVENCGFDNDSMENYVVKRRRKCKSSPPVIDDISDENYLANIVRTENYWGNCSRATSDTFNNISTSTSTRAKRVRKCKASSFTADVEGEEEKAEGVDFLVDDSLKSSIGSKRNYHSEDIIVVQSKLLQDFAASPLKLLASNDTADCTINSADYRNFRDLIDFRDLDTCECYGQEAALQDSDRTLTSHCGQPSNNDDAFATPFDSAIHEKKDKTFGDDKMMLSSHNGISSAAFASLHFAERLAVGKSQCAESERPRESSSGDSDVQHGDSGGVSSVHNSSSLTTANLSAHFVGFNTVHSSDSHSFSTCTSVPTTSCTSPSNHNSFGDGDRQVLLAYRSMTQSNHSTTNQSNSDLHYSETSSIENSSSFGNNNRAHSNSHSCVHTSEPTNARCSPFHYSSQSNLTQNHNHHNSNSVCTNWQLPDFQSHLLRRSDSSRVGHHRMRDEDSAIDELVEVDLSDSCGALQREDGSVVLDEDSEQDLFRNIIFESLLNSNDV